MACRHARRRMLEQQNKLAKKIEPQIVEELDLKSYCTPVDLLYFGVDSKDKSTSILQNNLTLFEWVKRNKTYPAFWGRNIVGENSLTLEEIDFLHDKVCYIIPIYLDSGSKETEEQGTNVARGAIEKAKELQIPKGTAIYLEITKNDDIKGRFIVGYAKRLIAEGYIPGFKSITDAEFNFDAKFSQAAQTDPEVIKRCLVWAVSPSLKEYYRVTTTHLLHPDEWMPFAPSCIKQKDVAIWQYGIECHPIDSIKGEETTFNVNLIDKENMLNNMF